MGERWFSLDSGEECEAKAAHVALVLREPGHADLFVAAHGEYCDDAFYEIDQDACALLLRAADWTVEPPK